MLRFPNKEFLANSEHCYRRLSDLLLFISYFGIPLASHHFCSSSEPPLPFLQLCCTSEKCPNCQFFRFPFWVSSASRGLLSHPQFSPSTSAGSPHPSGQRRHRHEPRRDLQLFVLRWVSTCEASASLLRGRAPAAAGGWDFGKQHLFQRGSSKTPTFSSSIWACKGISTCSSVQLLPTAKDIKKPTADFPRHWCFKKMSISCFINMLNEGHVSFIT